MSERKFHFGRLSDPRLAAQALSPMPAWLWSAEETPRLLWANPVAAAIFDAASPAAAAAIDFPPAHPAVAQIVRLVVTLPQEGTPRLERLRGFGAAFGGTLICLCSRLVVADDDRAAVLVVSTERAGRELVLAERAKRLLADLDTPAAVFSADGELIAAAAAGLARLGERRDLIALAADAVARDALRHGEAEGQSAAGSLRLLKLGAGPTTALLAAFAEPPPAAEPAEPANAAVVTAAPVPPPAETNGRRLPFRFVWQMDAAARFSLGTDAFARIVGPEIAAHFGEPWPALAQALSIDPEGKVAAAVGARETFSGIVVAWPADGSDVRLPVELSGLPMFDRDRQFTGYRGFGICRDRAQIEALERLRAAPPVQSQPRPAEAKVVPFPLTTVAAEKVAPAEARPALSPGEQSAFQELARELNARLKRPSAADDAQPVEPPAPAPPPERNRQPARDLHAARDVPEGRPILDRLPTGILIYRLNDLIYANRAFLDWTGYASLAALNEAGGLDSLFIETREPPPIELGNGTRTLAITTVNGQRKPVEGRLFSIAWNGETALVLMIDTQAQANDRAKAMETTLRRLEEEKRELSAILDTATDGVLVLDRAGRVLSANRSAQALFGYEADEFAEMTFADLLAPESRDGAVAHLERLARGNGARMLDAGREAIGCVRQGGLVPLYVTMGRLADGDKICVVLRDITAWKRGEEELVNARQEAEKASTAKSEFLAKISHEIRTPLNAIIGFSEVMMDERFGAIGNDRYRQYLRDIHASGSHVISLLNDLLDLSKIEAGKLELTFVSVDLNTLVQQCVAIMQPQANRERVIIRTSLPPNLPHVVADARSVRQIALNLLSNSIKFTGAGGQAIVSTAVNEHNEVVLRVRDTGAGMSEKELQTALEPFRQLATSARWGSGGTGLGLPITKALAEANHARFAISSRVDDGTLVEVAFPATRVLAR